MKKEKLCINCQKMIDLDKDKHVLLGTYNGSSVMDESFFHFNCWVEYNNSKLKEKLTNTMRDAGQKVKGIMGGMIKQAKQGSQGGQEVFDVGSEIPNMDEETKIF